MNQAQTHVRPVTDQSIYRIRTRAAARLAMLYVGKPFVHSLVNEFPKSGGSWLGKLIAGACGVSFPQNILPTDYPSVFHGHYMTRLPRVRKVVLWRDPRDIMVSWYYHCLFANDRNNHTRVRQIRSVLGFVDVENIEENLPKFIHWCFSGSPLSGLKWTDFYDAWHIEHPQIFHTSYEALHADTAVELGRLLADMGESVSEHRLAGVVEKHRFARNKVPTESASIGSSFLRKGIVGDWENVFTQDAVTALSHHMSGRVITLARGIDKRPVVG